MSVQDSDLFLVQRSGVSHHLQAAELMDKLQDDDLMLVNRNGASYKIKGVDLIDSLGNTPVEPTPDQITASPDFQGGSGTELDPYILQTIEVRPAGGYGASAELLTLQIPDAKENQVVVWTNNSVGSEGRFDQPAGLVDATGSWSGRLVYLDLPQSSADTDYIGKLQIGDVHLQWTVEQRIDPAEPPIVAAISVVENNPEAAPRFTDQTFEVNTAMLDQGLPVAVKTLDAYVEGNIEGVDNTRKYLQFDSNGNISDLLDAPQDPAYRSFDEAPALTLTFPSTFPSGKTPDEELAELTTLTVTITATNQAGSSTEFDVVQPTVVPDGPFVWEQRTNFPTPSVSGFAYGNHQGAKSWVIGAADATGNSGGYYAVSTNAGASWSSGTNAAPPYHRFNAIAYSDALGIFASVAGGNQNGNLYSTTGGTGWSVASGADGVYDYLPDVITREDGTFLACSAGGNGYQGFWQSTNGTSWSRTQTLASANWTRLGMGGTDMGQTKYIACGGTSNGSYMALSTNGSTFTATHSGSSKATVAAAYGKKTWVVIGNSYHQSDTSWFVMLSDDNAVSWNETPEPLLNKTQDLIFYNGWFIAVKNSNKIVVSADGSTWEEVEVTTDATVQLAKIAAGDDLVMVMSNTQGGHKAVFVCEFEEVVDQDPDQFAAQKLNFSTYNYRRDQHQAQLASSNRQQLVDQLTAAGYSQAQIEEQIGSA